LMSCCSSLPPLPLLSPVAAVSQRQSTSDGSAQSDRNA
jgi:hypothetical protein